VLNLVAESPDSWVHVCSQSAALRVLIYRVVILSDKYRLSLPACTALHVGRSAEWTRSTDKRTNRLAVSTDSFHLK